MDRRFSRYMTQCPCSLCLYIFETIIIRQRSYSVTPHKHIENARVVSGLVARASLVLQPLQHLHMALPCCDRESARPPRTSLLLQPPQHIKVCLAATLKVVSSQGHSSSFSHRNTSVRPSLAATERAVRDAHHRRQQSAAAGKSCNK